MSSSNSKDGSDDHPISIQKITGRLSRLLSRLSKAKDDPKKASIFTSHVAADGDSRYTAGTPNPLDKAYNELKYLISALGTLEKFEADLSEPLETLENNVTDILTDLGSTDSVKELIAHNLTVLRSNIVKIKVQIPLQHQASTSISKEPRYLQTTVASKEVGNLPNPYEADGIFESGSFLKEFQVHYAALDTRSKLCLLCFAVFPEKAEIKKRLLRFWWEGERLRSWSESDIKTKEKDKCSVNQILGKFVEMGFIKAVTKRSRSQTSSYKMHPIIRCLIIRLAKEANFFDYDPKGYPSIDFFKSKKICLVKSEGASLWSKNVPLPKKKLDPKANPNQQGMDSKWDEQQRIDLERKRVKYLEKLQTLFNVSKQFPDLPEELFSKMKNIGVLYLGRWERTAERHMEVENTDFLTGLKNMNKLRFFSLQGISGISKLPKSLAKLNNLRILDLRACHNLEKLPKEVGSLKRLTYLDLSECYLLDNIPKQLSKLSNLEVLKGFVISKNSSCTLENLTALSKLKKLSINVNNDDFSINEEGTTTIFSKFNSLKKLKIAWGAGGEGAKFTNENKKIRNKEKSMQRDKGKKKGNESRERNAAKSNDHKKQESVASKSGAEKATQKPKMPRGGASGMKLVKVDLLCYPEREPPRWLIPETLTCLKRLYIRGGGLSKLGQISMDDSDKKWKVEILRLKYLTDIKIDWKELRTQFPQLKYLEKVECPQIAFCPCDASGVWVSKQP